jgi:hypothetical protein
MRATVREEESALSHLVACGSRVTRDLIRSLLKAARSLAPALDLRWAFGTHRRGRTKGTVPLNRTRV